MQTSRFSPAWPQTQQREPFTEKFPGAPAAVHQLLTHAAPPSPPARARGWRGLANGRRLVRHVRRFWGRSAFLGTHVGRRVLKRTLKKKKEVSGIWNTPGANGGLASLGSLRLCTEAEPFLPSQAATARQSREKTLCQGQVAALGTGSGCGVTSRPAPRSGFGERRVSPPQLWREQEAAEPSRFPTGPTTPRSARDNSVNVRHQTAHN